MTRAGREGTGPRLRLARQMRGFSSSSSWLAWPHVSRQAVSAVEAGHSDPSLRVALALARALGMTVEELFGRGDTPPPVTVRPLAPLGPPGARACLAPMGDSFVAVPLGGDQATQAGFTSAGGVVAVADSEVLPIEPPRPTLVVAAQIQPCRSWRSCSPGSIPRWASPGGRAAVGEALRLAAAGLVHAAGAHLRGPAGEYNTGPARDSLRHGGAEVLGFAAWREGLALRPELAGKVAGLADAATRGLRLVNREEGSEARRVLHRDAARLGITAESLAGYGTRVTGHLQVAAAIAAGLADTGVASEPAAIAYGLAFLPLAAERFDLVIPAWQAGSRAVQALRKVLSSPWLLTQLDCLPGYDPSRCGERVAAW